MSAADAEFVARLRRRGSEDHGLVTRLMLRLHLAMCRRCRMFARQLAWISRESRQHGRSLENDLPTDFEERLRERLARHRS